MQIKMAMRASMLFSTEPGELVCINLSEGRIMAIVLRGDNPLNRILGVIDPAGMTEGVPFHFKAERNFPVLSFGRDWVLEPLFGPEVLTSSRSYIMSPGALHLDENGLWINFDAHPRDRMMSEIIVNLATLEFETATQKAAPFPHWRIWSSEADRLDPRAAPLFEFYAAAGQQ